MPRTGHFLYSYPGIIGDCIDLCVITTDIAVYTNALNHIDMTHKCHGNTFVEALTSEKKSPVTYLQTIL